MSYFQKTGTGNLKLIVRLCYRVGVIAKAIINEYKFSELGKKDILINDFIDDLILIQITFKKMIFDFI